MMSAAVDGHIRCVRDSMRHECMCACRERERERVCVWCGSVVFAAVDARIGCVRVCLERERERVCVL